MKHRIGYYDQKMDTICEVGTLREAALLLNEPFPVVSVIGAGGKTTTIHRLAEEYVQERFPVAVMSTTHMMRENHPWVCMGENESEQEHVRIQMQELLSTYDQLWIGSPARAGKMSQPPEWCQKEILSRKIPVLIEADGAKRLPLKVPAGHEPVILPQTTHVLAIYGMDSIGRTLEECCCRCELAEELLGCDGQKRVTTEDIAFFAASEQGGKKGCPADAKYVVVLNKADTEERRKQALEISRMLSDQGIHRIVVTSYI